MNKLYYKIKRLLKVLYDDKAIIISKNENKFIVDVCNNNKDETRHMATTFFREAYKLN